MSGRKDAAAVELGSRIRAARVALGWTIQQLADELGTAWSTVRGWEAGRSRPDAASVLLITVVLADELPADKIHEVFQRHAGA